MVDIHTLHLKQKGEIPETAYEKPEVLPLESVLEVPENEDIDPSGLPCQTLY